MPATFTVHLILLDLITQNGVAMSKGKGKAFLLWFMVAHVNFNTGKAIPIQA